MTIREIITKGEEAKNFCFHKGSTYPDHIQDLNMLIGLHCEYVFGGAISKSSGN